MKSTASLPRVFLDAPLSGSTVRIGERVTHYLSHVLRLKVGSPLIVFDGRGRERLASVVSLGRRDPKLSLGEDLAVLPEPAIELVLVQALIKSDAMDLVVQKATELGVRRILAVRSAYSVVKLQGERSLRRLTHWQRIAQSACEQSRRHFAPQIEVRDTLAAALAGLPDDGVRIVLDRDADERFESLPSSARHIVLAVGPEGGLEPAERELLDRAGFTAVRLGARTLRAETAAIAACALAQQRWGDLA